MRDEYLKEAQEIITDPNTLINVVSRRSKQLKHGNKPLVESLEKLEPEDIALRKSLKERFPIRSGKIRTNLDFLSGCHEIHWCLETF